MAHSRVSKRIFYGTAPSAPGAPPPTTAASAAYFTTARHQRRPQKRPSPHLCGDGLPACVRNADRDNRI